MVARRHARGGHTFDRFVDSLWKLDLDGGNPQRIQVLDWQVDSFAELDANMFLVNAQSGSFKGRLGTIGGEVASNSV